MHFTNKHVLKQFLKNQSYFKELEENYDISSILNQLANQISLKQHNKNTFLFHYDSLESNDWYVILKGKVSVYTSKTQQEILYEMSLLQKKQAAEAELQQLQLLPQSKENREKIRQAQLKKQEVEDTIGKISSNKYDYIFQKFHSSYYQQQSYILNFKFQRYAGEGQVFDKKFYDKPISVFFEEDSLVGYLKQDQYQKIFQGTHSNRQIITQALQKIQQKQDIIYHMKQVKDQSPSNSPIRTQIKNQQKERSQKQTVLSCENFGSFVENHNKSQLQQQQQQSKEIICDSQNNSRKARTRSNFEISLQKEVKELIRKQSSNIYDQINANYKNQQKNKLVTQSCAQSPKQLQQKKELSDNSPFTSKTQIQKGSFIDLINHQKQLIHQKQLLVHQNEKTQEEKSNKNQSELQLNQFVNSQSKLDYKNFKNKTEVSPQRQISQNANQQYFNQIYKKQLNLLIKNQIKSQEQYQQEQQSPITIAQNSQENTNSSKQTTLQHLQTIQNLQNSEKQYKYDTDPVRCSLLPTSSESFDDHYDFRIFSEGSKRTQSQSQQNQVEFKQQKQQPLNEIDIFKYKVIHSISDQKHQKQLEDKIFQKQLTNDNINNINDNSDFMSKQAHSQQGFNKFKNQKIYSQQQNVLTDLKQFSKKIENNEQNQKQFTMWNNGSDMISSLIEKNDILYNEITLNQELKKNMQTCQEFEIGNYTGQNQFVSSQSLNNSGLINQVYQQNTVYQMSFQPNLLEKSRSYAENLRRKHKKFLGRTQSQPSLIQNYSPDSSNQNSPISMKSKMQSSQRLSFSSLLQKQDSFKNSYSEGKNQSCVFSQNNHKQNKTDQQQRQKNNQIKQIICSTPQQNSRVNIQRSSSTLGFQSPQPQKLECPQSSGFRGKKQLSQNSKYSFIQAIQCNNKDQRKLTPSRISINQNRNQIDQQEINYQPNDQMMVSICKDGSIQINTLQNNINSQQSLNANDSSTNSPRLILQGKQNKNQNSLKQIGVELNKQVQQQKIQKNIVYSRVQSTKNSSNQLGPYQHQTQSQIQKELLKNKTSISKIVKGSVVTKITSDQQNLLNTLIIQNQMNSERKSLGNQLQENSIRQEILSSLQRKVDTKQNSLIKLQQCEKDQQNRNVQKTQNEDLSESKFTDRLIMAEQQKQIQDFKLKLQKPIQVNSVMQNVFNLKSCLKQNQNIKIEINQKNLSDESIDQCKDEYYLLKLIQQREQETPENYIGFEPMHQTEEESKDESNEFNLPNFGVYKSNSFHVNRIYDSQKHSKDQDIKSNQDLNYIENDSRNQQFKHKKLIYNTNGGSRRKFNNKQILDQIKNINLQDHEQITLGQNSNEDLFNVSNQQNESQYEIQNVKIHRSNDVDLNTQTFQKRRSSQGQKLVNILETPKFQFQKI